MGRFLVFLTILPKFHQFGKEWFYLGRGSFTCGIRYLFDRIKKAGEDRE